MHWSYLQVKITFKNHELLRGVSWDVKRGERVGLVGESQCWPSRSLHRSSRSLSHAALCTVVMMAFSGTSSITLSWAAGINGAGKTTQLQIIAGGLEPDSGMVIKERPNMKIAYLTQEFDVEPTRTVRVS